jgi:D-lactate dehydrogenase (cytochrome)
VNPTLVQELGDLLGDRLSSSASTREHHAKGESYHEPRPPDLVVFPHSTSEVSAIVRACARHRVPIVPFGAGTSLEGHVVALRGGVCVDVSRMTNVLAVHDEDFDAVVEAGVTHRQLNHHLRNSGLAFFVDPGADATLGGMAATRASGTNAVRYGTMRDNVLGLRVVLADGRVITTGTRARKSAAGYDLTRLFVGSEGTLGIITELVVRLHPRPEVVAVAVCSFETIHDAVQTVIATMQMGIPVARIELLDETLMGAINSYALLDYRPAPTLFFEFHAPDERRASEDTASVEALASERGGSGFQWVTKPEERARLWKARHDAYYASLALKPGCQALTTDVCVPISRLADCIDETRRETGASFLVSTLVGHVGDGNFHVLFLVDPAVATDLAEAHRLADRMVRRALAMGGTCTGEHGVGLGKLPFMRAEHGDALDVMRQIKAALDPLGIMNPGKLVG